MWSCCAGVTSSDALQEARRAEQEQERAKEFEELRKAKVCPDFVVLLCRRAYVPDALQEARRAERTQWQEQERKKQRDERNVRPDCVLCFARRD